MDEEIRLAKKQRRKAEKKWRTTRLQSDRTTFKAKRNHATYLINKARQKYYSNFIEENSANQKNLFKASKSLLNLTQSSSLPPYASDEKLANDMGAFFIKKITDIRSEFSNQAHCPPRWRDG